MTHLAIMKATPEGRVAKFQDYAREADARAHVAEWSNEYPKAFAAPCPEAPWSHWKIDMTRKSVTVEAPPAPEPAPEPVERRALRIVARFAGGEIDGTTASTQIKSLLGGQ